MTVRFHVEPLPARWPRDLTGPATAIDETAHIKHGGATACAAPQHVGGQVENGVTTVFSACVTASGRAWADFDMYLPDRWARNLPRRRADIPGDLQFATKSQLAMTLTCRFPSATRPSRPEAGSPVRPASPIAETARLAALAAQ
jgi:hypothetical protein